ncbi:MAG: hypothetical protein ICV74_08460 [Thermoleophilia bacterium]|nr:hypothetical protein [Thermoleophilia bacterium]
MTVCVGKSFSIDRYYDATPARPWTSISVFSPSGTRILYRAGRDLAKSPFSVRARRTGAYRTVYRRSGRSLAVETKAVRCADGGVRLSDDDNGSAMLRLTGSAPGQEAEACILVTYTGGSNARVRLYGRTGGSGLEDYLELTVVRGVLDKPRFRRCDTFRPDAADLKGLGRGVVYRGTLAEFPDSWSSGLVDPRRNLPERWTPGESHAYRFRVVLRDDDRAQALSALQSFTWEARAL